MKTALERAFLSLQALAIGDAFGDSFFGQQESILEAIATRQIPSNTRWEFTDDTVMAIAIYQQLADKGKIIPDELAMLFAKNYEKDVNRGYGATAHRILRALAAGEKWQDISANVFDGQGSMGNGAAMRVAPLGAFYADNIPLLIETAAQSAMVTHYHEEGKAGAIAVALAAAIAVNWKAKGILGSGEDFLKAVYALMPDSDTRSKIGKAIALPKTYKVDTLVAVLGNGSKMSAQDTVPFALWCAGHYLNHFEDALWMAVSALGDRDTNCAIAASIVALYADESTIPTPWKNAVESVMESIFWA